MKRNLLLTVIIALVLGFSGCDTGENGENIDKKGTISVYAGTTGSSEIANNSKGFTFSNTYIGESDEVTIVIKNTGSGDIKLTGSPYINLDGATAVFSVSSAPGNSTISPGSSANFKIKFTPLNTAESYVYVSIPNNSENIPDFSFTVYGTGLRPKPTASIFYGNSVISQNGTIQVSEDIVITYSKEIQVVIKNTGKALLTIDTANITITGEDKDVFTQLSPPVSNVLAGGETFLRIECKPVKPGVNDATLTIPTNDESRNQVVVHLRATAVRGAAILKLSQAGTDIGNNSLTPFNFGRVPLDSNKPLVFTIKNDGNINLELTGNPVFESSNPLFTVQTQPVNKTISPKADISFLLTYTPTDEKDDTGAITIYNDSDDMVFILNVKGTGYIKRPQITVRQDDTDTTINQNGEFDIGSVFLGGYKDVLFTIVNSGEANLTFETVNNNRINLENNSENLFAVVIQPSAIATVAPEGTTTFTVRFNPSSAGSNFTAIVKIKTNSQYNGEFSFEVKGNSLLAAPAGVTAVFQQPSSIVVSWNPVPGAASYKVYYGTSSSAITIVANSAVIGTSYTHTGLSAGTTYFYCITAQDDTSESARSQAVSMITLPGIPANLRSTASTYNSITVAWNAVTGAASYRLYYATSAVGSKTLVSTVSSGTSYTHTGLPANTTYYYFVTAVNNTGEGAYTEALSVRSLLAPLSPPNNVTAAALSTSSIQIAWSAVAGAASYKVYRATRATGARTLIDTVTTTSFTNTGLQAITYWYFVTAVNADNIESAESASASMIPKPNIPNNVSAYYWGYTDYFTFTVRIHWPDVPGAEYYRVYYATSPTGTKTLLGTTNYSDLYDNTANPNTTYYYWVKAFNAGGESDYSSQTSTKTPPTAPTNLRVTATTTNSITIAWNAAAGAAYYYIGGDVDHTQTQTSLTITGCSSKTWYSFYVRASTSDGEYGPWTETIWVQTK